MNVRQLITYKIATMLGDMSGTINEFRCRSCEGMLTKVGQLVTGTKIELSDARHGVKKKTMSDMISGCSGLNTRCQVWYGSIVATTGAKKLRTLHPHTTVQLK